jgi:hypothetical protein
MTFVTRPGMNQTLQETRRQREKARLEAVADLNQRRDGRDESIGRLTQHWRAGRRDRGRVDTRTAAKEMAERVFGNPDDEAAT